MSDFGGRARSVSIAMAQLESAPGDVEAGLSRARQIVAEARAGGADLVVFPELSLTGYLPSPGCEDLAIAAGNVRLTTLTDGGTEGRCSRTTALSTCRPERHAMSTARPAWRSTTCSRRPDASAPARSSSLRHTPRPDRDPDLQRRLAAKVRPGRCGPPPPRDVTARNPRLALLLLQELSRLTTNREEAGVQRSPRRARTPEHR